MKLPLRVPALTMLAVAALAAVCPAQDQPAGDAIPRPGVPLLKVAMPAKPPQTWLTYHLAHPGPGGTYPADPNFAIYWKDRYHLHYIYQPGAHNHCLAHVTSTDMVHWTWQPTPLTTGHTKHGMFSGTAFLTKEGKVAAIYHGLGSGKNQITLALDDNLEKWTAPYPMEAKTADGTPSKVKYWDPDCWWNGQAYYAISGGKPATLFKSADLKTWVELGPLLHDAMPATLGVNKNEDISCANMFKLGNKWMLLCISHGMGCRYYLGDFKDERFLPDFHGRMNWKGQEIFAPESLLTPDGRRVMWAWLQMGAPGVQGGIQSLPRELSLPEDGVLRMKPLRELETLRADEKSEKDIALNGDALHLLKEIGGDALELKIVIKPGTAKQFGVNVYGDKEGKAGFPITVDAAGKSLLLGAVKVPFEFKPDEEVTLRVFLDKNLIEVFANDRQAAAAMFKYVPGNLGVSLFSKGGDTVAKEIKGWTMKSCYASGGQ